ncbi:MAG: hypothetical protein U9R79_04535 [Armatimonadota bacterium]|nr:hypothetical protein [Armatimonadota bacterium]
MPGIGDQVKSVNRRVSRWARRTGTLVSQWWEEVSAIQERRSEIRELARERRRLLVEMGTKVYSLHRKGKVQNRDLRGDCERIDDIGESIDRLEQEIAELKRTAAARPPKTIEVEDESPVVGEEDIEEPAAEEPEPEAAEEGAEPCAEPEAPGEGEAEEEQETEAPAEGADEGGGDPSGEFFAPPAGTADLEGAGDMPQQPYTAPDDAEDQDAHEGHEGGAPGGDE